MNDRIKELALQATEIVEITDHCSGKSESTAQVNLAKFAELIVRECLDIAYDYDAPKMSGPGMIIAGRIETHFGVEEK